VRTAAEAAVVANSDLVVEQAELVGWVESGEAARLAVVTTAGEAAVVSLAGAATVEAASEAALEAVKVVLEVTTAAAVHRRMCKPEHSSFW
jgi:C4-dicarboxylate transporter